MGFINLYSINRTTLLRCIHTHVDPTEKWANSFKSNFTKFHFKITNTATITPITLNYEASECCVEMGRKACEQCSEVTSLSPFGLIFVFLFVSLRQTFRQLLQEECI